MKLQTPPDTGTLNVDGHEYTPEADGSILAIEPTHVPALMALGCVDPSAPPPAPIAADEPPAVPEGMTDPEVVRALIVENEDQKQVIIQMSSDLQAAKSRAGGLETDLLAVKTELAVRTGENDQLRDHIQELEARLNGVTIQSDGTGGEALGIGGAETATEEVAGAAGGAGAAEVVADAEEAPESPIKEVDGITVSDPEAFDAMEYNPLKAWLAAHGVHVPHNISKPKAIEACKVRFVELTTPAA